MRCRRSGSATSRGACSSTPRRRCRWSPPGRPRKPTSSAVSDAHRRTWWPASRLPRPGWLQPVSRSRDGSPPSSPASAPAPHHSVILTGETGGVTGPERVAMTPGRLARAGFADPDAAGVARRALALDGDARVVPAPADTAAPDSALSGLMKLADAASDRTQLLSALGRDEPFRERLLGILGVSTALGDHLGRHPAQWHLLAAGPDDPDADMAASRPSRLGLQRTLSAAVGESTGRPARDALRVAYRGCLLTLAARDVSGGLAVDDVAGELADLAEATLGTALEIARREHPTDSRLAVIGMGKCGGRELNYVSDVDVVFVAEPADAGA